MHEQMRSMDLRADETAGWPVKAAPRERLSRIVEERADQVAAEVAEQAAVRCLLIDEAEMTRRALVHMFIECEGKAQADSIRVEESVHATFAAAEGREGLPLGSDDQVGSARAAFHRLGLVDRDAIFRVHILGCTASEAAADLRQEPSVFLERLSGARKRFVQECRRFSCTDSGGPDGQVVEAQQ